MKMIFWGLLLMSHLAMAVTDVQVLNQKISKSKAGWVARETSVSHLSKEETQRRFGLQFRDNHVDFKAPAGAHVNAALPSKLDWRNQNGQNYVSPILNQANCGSCVAFASIGVLETQYRISSGLPNFNIKLSPQNLFSCGGGGCDFGWMPAGAARYLQSQGVPDEACMPYTSGATGQDVSCQATCANSNQRSLKISSSTTPTRGMKDVDALKQALQKGPLVTTLTVYADFMSYSEGVYNHVSGDALGGHALSIVGYDDSLQAFLIRNSWGPDWGQGGFAWVSYEDISGIGEETWQYEVPVGKSVSVNAPLDYQAFTATLPLDVVANFSQAAGLKYSIYQGAQVVANGTCASSHCQQPVDISKLADGRYEIDAAALDASGAVISTSTRHLFYVANVKPTLTLSFTGTNGTNLTSSLSDRIEMQVTTGGSVVPMTSLEFHYKGPDGVEHSHSSDIVMSKMVTGWRTNLSPNGNYQIWMKGTLKTNGFESTVSTAPLSVLVQN